MPAEKLKKKKYEDFEIETQKQTKKRKQNRKNTFRSDPPHFESKSETIKIRLN